MWLLTKWRTYLRNVRTDEQESLLRQQQVAEMSARFYEERTRRIREDAEAMANYERRKADDGAAREAILARHAAAQHQGRHR